MKSIYETISENLSPDGFLPGDGPLLLPDHDSLDEDLRENWVPGEFEAVMVRLPYRIKEISLVNYLFARTLARCIRLPTRENRDRLLAKLRRYAVVSVADPVLSHLAGMHVDRMKARKLALDFVQNGTERNVVKFGIVLLGAYGQPEDCELIGRLGVHEEFTFFAVKAMRNLDKSPAYQQRLIRLGERTDGWGKIAVILEFDDTGLTDETKDWILRHGCKNRIGLHYTACECGIKGGLVQYLSSFSVFQPGSFAGAVDAEMTEGICDIVDGLMIGATLKDADGIHEMPNARGLVSAFKWVADNDGFTGEQARVENLKNALCKAVNMII